MTYFLAIYGLGLTLLSILPFRTFGVRAFWLASVVATEYGAWLVLLALFGAALAGRSRRRVVMAGFFVLAASFAMPAVQLHAGFEGWERQLRQAFGGALDTSAAKRPRLLDLWFPPRDGAPPPRRITFARDPELELDVYPTDRPGAAPWVLVIHGGGWDSGDRRQMPELNHHLASRGIGVVAVDYRLAPRWPWPAARDDVARAIAFVKAHAAELRLDPSRFVVLGRSAGGQLAEMIAYGGPRDPALRGVIALYAPSDMNNAYAWGAEDDILGSRPLVRAYMGGPPERDPAAYRAASALPRVRKDAPPTLLLHGARDPIVWIRHSELLADALRALRVPAALIEVPWGTHGFDYNLWGPGGQVTRLAVEHFLERVFAND